MLSNCELLTYLLVLTVFCCDFLQLVECQYPRERLLPWTKDKYPNPWLEPTKCGRNFPTLICDVDKLLTIEQVTDIDKVLWDYGRTAPCLCDSCGIAGHGIKIGIALMEDADVRSDQFELSYGKREKKLTWQQFADHLRKRWSLGNCENDVVVVISPFGGAISFGEVSKKILEKSAIPRLTEYDFPKSQNEQYKFIRNLLNVIHSYDLNKALPKLEMTIRRQTSTNLFSPSTKDTGQINASTAAYEGSDHWPTDIFTVHEHEQILIAGSSPISKSSSSSSSSSPSSPSSPSSSSSPGVNTWGANSYIAAAEDDEFKIPEDNKISSSLAFMIVGSLTVILVSLIALFLIIWYYRTKTGNIEPSTMNIKPQTDEKTSIDIKSVKYEPCKTDEPGLPV